MIIEDLKTIKSRPYAFINPVTPEMLKCFISGLVRGYLLTNFITYEDYRHASKQSIFSRGWKIKSTSPYHEMQEKNMPENEIIEELLDIEIETWKILESESTENSK